MIMVAFAVEDSPVDLGSSAQIVARCHVADYLRDAGIRHPDLLSSLSKRFVEEAEQLLEDTQPAGMDGEHHPYSAAELCEAALRLALRELESTVELFPGAKDFSGKMTVIPGGSNGGTAELQEAPAELAEGVEASSKTLGNSNSSRYLDRRLQGAVPHLAQISMVRIRPSDVAPESQKIAMRAQLRPKLLRVFRKGYWRGAWKNLCQVVTTVKLRLEPVR
ncbi:hypothetical protein Spb1_15380 [Planctopirus ephydatiae]|uniref:Uncharacterized protein n=1 Tax=Planctopirus ephydatiae TaxID=2528019 RepID=A0A518GLT4_9PLAN|nr:hypothetical protein [Planctopirus ephydatiae]QDV29625.1 hypothetical protein Spb1_15380 [Planctopirus ephydatiae]